MAASGPTISMRDNAVMLLLLLSALAAFISTAAAQPPGDVYAYIAHQNDVHNRLEEEEPSSSTPCLPATKAKGRCVGGWSRIHTQIKALRLQAARERAGFFFLDAGDEFTGTLWDIIYRGSITAQVMNMGKIDVAIPGNHEWDYGTERLAQHIGNLTMPYLGGCNVDGSQDPHLNKEGLFKKWTVLKYAGKKIGVLGWVTPDTAITTTGVGETKFLPIIPSVTTCLAELKAAEPDLDFIIGLSHCGYDSDLETAAAVPGLDLIIGGHSHSFLYSPTTAGPIVTTRPGVDESNCLAAFSCDKPYAPYPTYVNDVAVVQAYYSSKYLGVLKINLSKRKVESGKVTLLGGTGSSNNVQPHPAMFNLISQWAGPVNAMQSEITGRTAVRLDGSIPNIRMIETNLGSYVADIMVESVPAGVQQEIGVKIGLVNGGAIRNSVPTPGDITVGQVMTIVPFPNLLSIFTLTGAGLINTLKHGLTDYPSGGRFLQVTGVRYYHHAGKFLKAMLLDKDGTTEEIDPSKRYGIVSVDFILGGGDGFSFPDAEVILPSAEPLQQTIMGAMKAVLPDAINPSTYDRIIDCAKTPLFTGCPAAK